MIAKFKLGDAVKTPMGEGVICHSLEAAKPGLKYFVRCRRTVQLLGRPTEVQITEWWREDQLEQV